MTALPLCRWRPDMAPQDISRALFAGQLLSFRGLKPVAGLVQRAQCIVSDVFGTDDYVSQEGLLEPRTFRKRASTARKAVAADAAVKRLWRECLSEVGYLPETTYFDRVRLRVIPSRENARGRIIRPLPPHRDTWGSGIMAQINWWLPLHPLVSTHTMVVWPDAFQRPIENDSAEWDYDTLLSRSDPAYCLLPTAQTAPDGPGFAVLVEPGEMIAFSAAHLHATTVDTSGKSRFSLDARTVWSEDISAGRCAPNVDGALRKERWEWFELS